MRATRWGTSMRPETVSVCLWRPARRRRTFAQGARRRGRRPAPPVPPRLPGPSTVVAATSPASAPRSPARVQGRALGPPLVGVRECQASSSILHHCTETVASPVQVDPDRRGGRIEHRRRLPEGEVAVVVEDYDCALPLRKRIRRFRRREGLPTPITEHPPRHDEGRPPHPSLYRAQRIAASQSLRKGLGDRVTRDLGVARVHEHRSPHMAETCSR